MLGSTTKPLWAPLQIINRSIRIISLKEWIKPKRLAIYFSNEVICDISYCQVYIEKWVLYMFYISNYIFNWLI